MVCSFCQGQILESGKPWDFHHYTFPQFQASIQDKCLICTKLAEDLFASLDPAVKAEFDPNGQNLWLKSWLGKHTNLPAREHAVFRWTLRNASAVTRDGQDMVVLRFRPNTAESQGQPLDRKRLRLRDRTFYFFREDDDDDEDDDGEGPYQPNKHVADPKFRSRLGRIPEPDQLGPEMDLGSTGLWEQVGRWMDRCEKKHPNCARKHAERDFVPTRLVDVGPINSTESPKTVRVVVTDESHRGTPYATVSHCWGKDRFVTLTHKNKKEFMGTGVPWEDMGGAAKKPINTTTNPVDTKKNSVDTNEKAKSENTDYVATNKNFIDAIMVARKLKIQYIWIDSLCIIQGPGVDGQPSDFSKEGKLMHKVYRNSACNIASAAVDKGNKGTGLFKSRDDGLHLVIPERFVPSERTVPLLKNHTWRIVTDRVYEEGVLNKVLYSRGWVFQERLLSPRILHFSDSQVFWECSTMTAPESIPNGLPLPLDAPAAAPDRHWRQRLQQAALSVRPMGDGSLEEFWSVAVRAYTSCSLTDQKDKLIAIWGVAKLVRDVLKQDFAAGLWSKALAEQLSWRVASDAAQRPSDLGDLFPSWSWMSVLGGIEVGSRIRQVRAWVVEGDEGKEPHFRLQHRFTAVKRVGMNPKWEEELQIMKNLTDGVIKKRAAHPKRTTTDSDEKDANSANTKESPQDREVRLGKKVSEAIQKQWNELPELKPREIVIKGHVMKGVLKKPDGTNKWTLSVQTAGLPVSMDAFPDVTTLREDEKDVTTLQKDEPDATTSPKPKPKLTFAKPVTDNSECEFVILTMSCKCYQPGGKTWVDRKQFGTFKDDELASWGAKFEGNGILVEKDGDIYKRIGAMAFGGLDKEAWDRLRESCCGRGTGNGVHGLDEGIQIRLD